MKKIPGQNGSLSKEELEIVSKNFEEFITTYGNLYPSNVIEYIKKEFFSFTFLHGVSTDIMNQVYEETGVFEIFDNIYDKNLSEMQCTFDLDRDILEVGCGYFPAFASRVSKLQTKGSITVMDALVVPTTLGKVNIEKKMFSLTTDVSKYKMMYGLMPCESTLDMIDNAKRNDLDLYIMLCNCSNHSRLSLQDWYSQVKKMAKIKLPTDRELDFIKPSWASAPILKIYKK